MTDSSRPDDSAPQNNPQLPADAAAPVDRCVCHDVTFARMRALAQEKDLDFAGLQRATGCGSGCGLCEPYVRLMLRTGRTAFPVLSADQAAEIMRKKEA